jgi:hypothetical protein
MEAGEVALVAEDGGGLQREVGQVHVAGVALAAVELLLVRVAAEAGLHRRHRLLETSLLREREVADLALLVLLQMLRVIDDEVRRLADVGRRLVGLQVAHPALACVLLLLVAAEADLFLGERPRLTELGLVEDGLVAGEAVHPGLLVARVVGIELELAARSRACCSSRQEDGHHPQQHAEGSPGHFEAFALRNGKSYPIRAVRL